MFIHVTTYNRSNIAVPSIQQLLTRTNNGLTIPIVINDDGSTDEQLNLFLLSLKKKFNCKNINVQLLKHAGVEEANVNRIECTPSYFLINHSFVYFTDDDMNYSSKFIVQLNELKEYMLQNNHVFAATLFNVNHFRSPAHMPIGIIDNYHIKPSFGGCSMLIRTTDFLNAIEFYKQKNYNGKPGWDWAICHYAHAQGKLLIATKDSYVQHVGISGVNSTPHTFDFAINFIE